MKKLAIVGASGHGKVVADLAECLGYEVIFFDDTYPKKQKIEHWPVLGTIKTLLSSQHEYPNAVVAIGNNDIRAKIYEKLLVAKFKFPSLIHPNAIVSQYADIAAGSVVFANAVINAFAKIGANCIVNTSTVVEHDCILADSVHLSPNVTLAGGTIIGKLSWLGIGSVTRQLVIIGERVIVGANATVIDNISSNITVVGTPAASVKK